MADTKSELKHILLKQVRENKAALRQVNRQSEKYVELVESVREKGVLNAIVVRPLVDEDTKETYYGLVDGLHRYSAACDAGLNEIPANIKTMEEAEALEAQIIGNIHRVETKPVEYSRAIQRLMAQNPLLSIAEMANTLAKSKTWVSERLGLLKLDDKIAELVDGGDINLSNAFALAKLPPEEQAAFVERAMTMTPQEFTPTVHARKKELDKARREGRDASTEEFQPQPFMQKLADLKSEFQNCQVGPTLIKGNKVKSAVDGFALGVAWVLHMDPSSQDVQKDKDTERKAKSKAKREAAAVERKGKRAEDASLKATRLEIDAKHAKGGTDPAEDLAAFDKAHGLVDGKKPAKTESKSR
jgi:ParB/RepB/Spo0J family partition protein